MHELCVIKNVGYLMELTVCMTHVTSRTLAAAAGMAMAYHT